MLTGTTGAAATVSAGAASAAISRAASGAVSKIGSGAGQILFHDAARAWLFGGFLGVGLRGLRRLSLSREVAASVAAQ